jgi:hypothetical protein
VAVGETLSARQAEAAAGPGDDRDGARNPAHLPRAVIA